MSISDRAIGQYPLSIPTSLALESAAGIHPDIKVSSPPILKYDELWCNVKSLYRNFIGSLDKNTVGGVTPLEIAETISVEMETIISIISDVTNNKTKVIYYFSDYAGLDGRNKFSALRMDSTDKQKEYTGILNSTLELLIKIHGKDIKIFKLKIIPTEPTKALILTNYAYDLLAHNSFTKLSLLESHTGHIKEFAQFSSKFVDGKELSNIPFNKCMLQVFGDSVTYRPMSIVLRREIMELAKKYKWASTTTDAKMLYGFNTLTNQYHRDVLKSML